MSYINDEQLKQMAASAKESAYRAMATELLRLRAVESVLIAADVSTEIWEGRGYDGLARIDKADAFDRVIKLLRPVTEASQ